jgi:hypothetical protein
MSGYILKARPDAEVVAWEIGTYAIDTVSADCGPGGSGVCDGYDPVGGTCDCACHGEPLADYAAVVTFHKDRWALDSDGELAAIYAPNNVRPVYADRSLA